MPLTISQLLRYTLASDRHAANYVHVHAWRGFYRRDGTHGVQVITITRERGQSPRRHQVEIATLSKTYPGKISDRGAAVVVSCNCERFLFYYEWVLAQHGAAELRYSNGEPPYITNPTFRVSTCIAENSLIPTRRGLLPIQEVNCEDEVYTLEGFSKVSAAAYTGLKKVIRLKLRSGKSLVCTPDHLLQVVRNNTLCWLNAGKLKTTDFVVTLLAGVPNNVPKLPIINPFPKNNGIKLNKIPQYLTGDLARLLGYMVAEGGVHSFGNFNVNIINDFIEKVKRVFGIDLQYNWNGTIFLPATLSRAFEKLGIKWGSYNKIVPDIIMKSNDYMISEFLRGYYGGDGYLTNTVTTGASASQQLIFQLQQLLSVMGIYTTINTQFSGINKTLMYSLRTSARKSTAALLQVATSPRGSLINHNYTTDDSYKSGALSRTVPLTLYYYIKKWATIKTDKEVINFLVKPNIVLTLRDALKILPTISGKHRILNTEQYRTILAKRLTANNKLKTMRLRRGGKPHNAALLHDIIREIHPELLTANLHMLRRKASHSRRLNKITILQYCRNHGVDLIDPTTYGNIEVLCREEVMCDQVIAIESLPNKARVYDLTIPNVGHFVANSVVVHNCKHLFTSLGYVQHYSM